MNFKLNVLQIKECDYFKENDHFKGSCNIIVIIENKQQTITYKMHLPIFVQLFKFLISLFI